MGLNLSYAFVFVLFFFLQALMKSLDEINCEILLYFPHTLYSGLDQLSNRCRNRTPYMALLNGWTCAFKRSQTVCGLSPFSREMAPMVCLNDDAQFH